MGNWWQEIQQRKLERFVVVTLVKADRSVPQEVGAKMLVDLSCGSAPLWGTIGGGAVEKEAVEYAKELLQQERPSELKFFHLQDDLEMACGGEVTLFFDVQLPQRWAIAIFGAGHVAQHLVRILLTLNCQLDCFDTRQEWLAQLPTAANLHRHLLSVEQEKVAPFSDLVRDDAFCIIMTHGHRLDLPIAQELIKANKGSNYLGIIGSKSKAKTLAQQLLARGVEAARVAAICSPIGLPIGNNTPAEIAISIAAQLLEVRDKKN